MPSMLAAACGLVVLSGIPSLQAAAQSEPMPVEVAPFRSVELRSGGKVIVRHGPAQRVTFIKGSPGDAQVTVTSEGGLIIEKRKSKGARRSELEIEVLTPELIGVTVAHGGMIQSRGSFPRQAALVATVDNGGTVDVRSMSVGTVSASVLSGGRILAKPLTAMAASVAEGGNITYWGDARVTQSIQHGGVIEKGDPSEADQPLSNASDAVAPVPPIPPTRGH